MGNTTLFEDSQLLVEQAFTASASKQIADGDALNLSIHNPAGSGKKLLFFFGDASHETDVDLTMYDEVSGVSGGSGATVNNNVFGGGESTAMTVQEDVTFTPENEHQQAVFIGGGVEDVFDGYRAVLPPSERLLVELANLSGGNNNWGSLRLSWVELEA